MQIKRRLNKYLRPIGFELISFTPGAHSKARRMKLFETYGINLVLDVGANIGSYSMELKDLGYKGKIVSFEPLSEAYKGLEKNASRNKNWIIKNLALGAIEGFVDLNISGNSYSSSILEMLEQHRSASPDSKYIGKEKISIRKLDDIFFEFSNIEDNVYLKIDTQGYEKHVLDGAQNVLKYIDTIQVEMSLVPLYKEQMLFKDMYEYMSKMNYSLVSLEPGFTHNSGQLLQLDGIFHRN